jgi:hypothetical protein
MQRYTTSQNFTAAVPDSTPLDCTYTRLYFISLRFARTLLYTILPCLHLTGLHETKLYRCVTTRYEAVPPPYDTLRSCTITSQYFTIRGFTLPSPNVTTRNLTVTKLRVVIPNLAIPMLRWTRRDFTYTKHYSALPHLYVKQIDSHYSDSSIRSIDTLMFVRC